MSSPPFIEALVGRLVFAVVYFAPLVVAVVVDVEGVEEGEDSRGGVGNGDTPEEGELPPLMSPPPPLRSAERAAFVKVAAAVAAAFVKAAAALFKSSISDDAET